MRSRFLRLSHAAWLLVGIGCLVPAAAGATDRQAALPTVLAQVFDDEPAGGDPQGGGIASLTVRMDRMENTIRTLTGEVEQLQFQNKKLTDDLRKMQEDVDFRFQDLSRGGGAGSAPARQVAPANKRTDLDVPVGAAGFPTESGGATSAAPTVIDAPAVARRRTSDAFDPDSNPTAPGAPKPLGSTPASAPFPGRATAAATPPNAPLDLMKRPDAPAPVDQSTENGVSPILPGADVPPAGQIVRAVPNPNVVASLVPGGTRDEFNADLDLYKQGQYDGAASGLKTFLDRYPRDRLVPDAVYLLGESYTRLGRHREAAEQYLRLSTDFSKAPRAPDALLRLGMSLNAMGVREQACATYQEVPRRFPTASAELRASVDRELKRARC